ncbi:MAG TPA: sugar phosphate nucleotidyltransferase [Halobacteriales archaeon]|nr:sugar phosphate nucleotidyltransferase [Halobacteriales archaeon]
MTIRDAVVLAAGEGTRLRPLTRHRPKPMLPAANRPILEYVFDALIDAGIERITVVVGYKHDRVQNHFGSDYRDVPIGYVHQQKQLGSGHALLQASEAVDDPFIVVNGDQIADPRMVAAVMEAAQEGDAVARLAVIEREEVGSYGAVTLEGDRVVDFIEKPQAGTYHLLNAGVYAFDGRIFDVLDETPRREGDLDLPDAIGSIMAADEPIGAVRTRGIWIDATYPWDLLAVARDLLAAGWIDVDEAGEGTWIADSARIHDSAVVQSPVVVGPDAVVGPGAVVGPHTALGRNVTVGANAVVQSSVVDEDTRVDAGATLVDCVTGQGVRVGAGTVVPGGSADVTVAGTVHEDQRLGAVLADRVRLGGGASVAPGSLVGPNAEVDAGGYVRGTVKADARVMR